MAYRLEFYLICVLDSDPPSEKDKFTKTIEANSVAEAVRVANEHLLSRKARLGGPWAPMLYEGDKLVAASLPSYPPKAHHLEECVS